MQTTSATWKQLWESGTAWLECKAIINGVEYTGIVPAINRALTQGGLSIGNAVAATCQFTIHTDNVIPKSAKVEIKKRLTDGTTSSEWLNVGTYFISRRTKDIVTGKISLECYDSLLKSNAIITDVPWTDTNGNVITTDTGEWIYFTTSYPRRMIDMAEDIALLLGVELDPRNQIKTGANYIINAPDAGATVNDILRKIANANGGNWVISPDNKLRLVPVLSAADAESATDDVIYVEGIVGNIGVNSVGVVTGVRYQSEDRPVILGDDTGIVLDVDDAGFAYELYDELIGIVYSSFSLNGAIYNPAAELGDYVLGGANGEIRSVLFSENCTLGMAFRGDISAPEAEELNDEYPYMGKGDKVLIASKAYAQEASETAESNAIAATNALNESLNQEGVFNRLTNNGEAQGIYLQDGKIYVSASYIKTGTMIADFIKGGTLTLGGLNNTNGVLQVLDASGNVIGTWNKDGITLNKGTIAGPSITLGGSNNTSGALTVKNASGTTIGTWNNNGISVSSGSITGGTINGASLTLGGNNNASGTLTVKNSSGTTIGTWNKDGITLNSGILDIGYYYGGQSSQYRRVTFGTGNDNVIYAKTTTLTGEKNFYFNNQGITVSNYDQGPSSDDSGECVISFDGIRSSTNSFGGYGPKINLENTDNLYRYTFLLNGNGLQWSAQGADFVTCVSNPHSGTFGIKFYTNFSVTGSKSRIVTTDQYSDRLLYCYETPSPMFGDVGEGVVGEDGLCYVPLDAVFAQTVTTSLYQVFLQSYGEGACFVAERRGGYFIVQGTPGLAFGWEVKAKQRDYDQLRLERADEPFTVPEQSYGADAAQYINQLEKGRILE